jgi:hypothetical protein
MARSCACAQYRRTRTHEGPRSIYEGRSSRFEGWKRYREGISAAALQEYSRNRRSALKAMVRRPAVVKGPLSAIGRERSKGPEQLPGSVDSSYSTNRTRPFRAFRTPAPSRGSTYAASPIGCSQDRRPLASQSTGPQSPASTARLFCSDSRRNAP